MLCRFDFLMTYAHTGPVNFPCNDNNHFMTVFLASSPEEAVFELNTESLIRPGYSDNFTDLEEIQQEETQSHAISRESIEEILGLSAIQRKNFLFSACVTPALLRRWKPTWGIYFLTAGGEGAFCGQL